ncbi:MAG TPA: zinc-binding dehydrogenase [Jatrophihabitans sp.]|jgi:NADPH2:quinone reductase
MKAIVVREFGGPDVLEIAEVPTPEPGPGEILIAVEYAGVNFTDVRNRVGDGLGEVPFIPGVEVSGTVIKLGPGVALLEVGQRVAAFTRGHAYAEFALAREEFTLALPDRLADQPKAAGMLVTIPLAVNVIERSARVLPGESVLLHAASGGVGSVVGQLLQQIEGVRLFGTVGDPAKADFAREHGYAEVMTYAEFGDQVMALTDGRGVDVVLDPIGGDVQSRSLEILAPFGRLVSYSNISRAGQALPDAEWMRARCVGYVGLSNGQLSARDPRAVRDGLARAVELVASGAVEVDVTSVLPLAEAAQAHRVFENRSAVGKFILSM